MEISNTRKDLQEDQARMVIEHIDAILVSHGLTDAQRNHLLASREQLSLSLGDMLDESQREGDDGSLLRLMDSLDEVLASLRLNEEW